MVALTAPQSHGGGALCPGPDDDGEEARADQLLQAVITEDQHEGSLSVHAFMALQKRGFPDRPRPLVGDVAAGAGLGLLHHGGALHGVRQAAVCPAWHRRDYPVCRNGHKPGAGGERGIPLHITLAPGIKMPEDAHLFVLCR